MADLAASLATAGAAFIHQWGTSYQYSRPTGAPPVAAFSLVGIPATSGEFMNPVTPLYGSLQVVIADIPEGPQKGDFVEMSGLTYAVHEIFANKQQGDALLMLRWTGQ